MIRAEQRSMEGREKTSQEVCVFLITSTHFLPLIKNQVQVLSGLKSIFFIEQLVIAEFSIFNLFLLEASWLV
jgi:hypothetical protein